MGNPLGVQEFLCGNSILYNERVEIGGYTIQFYHKLEQPFRSYCHKNIMESASVLFSLLILEVMQA